MTSSKPETIAELFEAIGSPTRRTSVGWFTPQQSEVIKEFRDRTGMKILEVSRELARLRITARRAEEAKVG